MQRKLLLAFNGLLLLQLVASQARTAWQAGAGAGGMGLGTAAPVDFTEHQINMAMVGVNSATTEQAAVQAALAVYHPTLDMADAVKGALETKVRQLRTPPGWTAPIPPPLPFGFDPMNLIMAAYYKGATGAPAGATGAPVAQPHPKRPRRPQRRGPPTSIRRGPTAPAPAQPAGSSLQISYPNAWQPQNAAASAAQPQYPPQQWPAQQGQPPQWSQQVPQLAQPSWQQVTPKPMQLLQPWQTPSQNQQQQSAPPPSSMWVPPRQTQHQTSRLSAQQPASNNADPLSALMSLLAGSSGSASAPALTPGWQQNNFGNTAQLAPPPIAPSPSPLPDFTPLASSMPGWISPFYNPSSNPSAWK